MVSAPHSCSETLSQQLCTKTWKFQSTTVGCDCFWRQSTGSRRYINAQAFSCHYRMSLSHATLLTRWWSKLIQKYTNPARGILDFCKQKLCRPLLFSQWTGGPRNAYKVNPKNTKNLTHVQTLKWPPLREGPNHVSVDLTVVCLVQKFTLHYTRLFQLRQEI